jgi:hypothetical protein
MRSSPPAATVRELEALLRLTQSPEGEMAALKIRFNPNATSPKLIGLIRTLALIR